MDKERVKDFLRRDKFQPCAIVTENGERYEVHDRRYVVIVTDGTVHIYEPSDREDATVEGMTRIPMERIAAIEPLSTQAA